MASASSRAFIAVNPRPWSLSAHVCLGLDYLSYLHHSARYLRSMVARAAEVVYLVLALLHMAGTMTGLG